MRRFPSTQLLAATALIGFALLTGCDKKGTTGGPGVTSTTATATTTTAVTTTTVANSKETFNLTAPSTSTTIKQGDSKTVKIGLSRGRDFDQAVSISFAGLPAGVTIDPAAPTIKSGDKDVTVAVVAAPDAAPGESTIKVTGHPATGDDSTTDFKISVDKK